jgi:hypothetical protein
MREDLKFDPRYSTPQSFESFAASVEAGPLSADRIRAAEHGVASVLGVEPREEVDDRA